MLSRRGLLFGLGASLIVAPAIVHASSLMPIKVFEVVRKRRIVAELDPMTKVVRWRNSGEYVDWTHLDDAEYTTKVGQMLDPLPEYHNQVKEYWYDQEKVEPAYYNKTFETWFHDTWIDADTTLRDLAFKDIQTGAI